MVIKQEKKGKREMKVIDLLNKIANNGVDDKIRHIKYYNRNDEENDICMLCYENLIYKLNNGSLDLNDEVEIIEEEKKIPEKLDHLIGYDIQQFDDLKEYVEITTNDLFGKVNKVIDTLNQVLDYLKSKGDE